MTTLEEASTQMPPRGLRQTVARGLEWLLEWVVIIQIASLAIVVIAAVAFRTFGAPLDWYDEIASVQLAWLTYYGSALAALKRAHIGFPGIVAALPPRAKTAVILLGEAMVIGFFALLTYMGWIVLQVLSGETLVSLPIPLMVTQSVIPIGGALFILCQLLSLPDALGGKLGGEH